MKCQPHPEESDMNLKQMSRVIEPFKMTMDEITQAHGKCYMEFYGNKMQEIANLAKKALRKSTC